MTRRRVVFACRAASGENLRSAQAIAKLDNVILLGVTQEPSSQSEVFAEVVSVTDVHDASQLIDAAARLRERHGELARIVTTQETLLEPVALAGEALGVSGVHPETIRRVLDKSLLKSTLNQAGLNTPRGQIVSTVETVERFVNEAGFPIVLKPVTGSGALATLLVRDAEELARATELVLPALAEIHLRGQELCLDTITIDNEPRFYSICCYHPSILEAIEQPKTQWRCVMPREMDTERFRNFIQQGLAAVRALSVGNAMTHMEGFVGSDGTPCFTDATLRPAGARIAPMLAFAYDIDPYHAWARVAVDGCFDGPWERRYAVGTVFLRGIGSGSVEQVAGIDTVQREVGDLLVDARWPRIGARKAETYTGDGFVTIRHAATEVVQQALDAIARSIRITYSNGATAASADAWKERVRNYRELNRPAWDSSPSSRR